MPGCPHLGLKDDPETAAAFRSADNCCFRIDPPAPVHLFHQEAYCLGEGHTTCPVFLTDKPRLLIHNIRMVGGEPEPRRATRRHVAAVVTVLAAVGLLAGLWLGRDGLASLREPAISEARPGTGIVSAAPPATATAALSAAATATVVQPAATATPSHTATPTLTPTTRPNTPTATATPEAEACGPAPDGWIAYEVQPDDTLAAVSAASGATVAAIVAANCLAQETIRAGMTLYLPAAPPTSEPCGPPTDWALYLVRLGDTLSSLARRFNTTVALIVIANCLETTGIFAGTYIYLPRPATPPPPAPPPAPTSTPVIVPTATAAPAPSATSEPPTAPPPTVPPPPTATSGPPPTPTPPAPATAVPVETATPPPPGSGGAVWP